MALRSGRVGIHPSQVDPITGMLLNGPTPGSMSLSALQDVQITDPEDGAYLVYDAANSKWINSTTPPAPVVPEGSTVTPTDDIQTWLACAGITDKTYTTINEVLADSTTLLALMSNNNASDYLVRSTSWATASGLVPTMTSNTTPSGVVSASQENASSAYKAYKAFDNDNSTGWYVNDEVSTNQWIGYDFGTAVTVRRVKVRPQYYNYARLKNINIQYSDDGSVYSGNNEFLVPNADQDNEYILTDTGSHRYWRMFVSDDYGSTIGCAELQFYTCPETVGICDNSTAMTDIGANNYCANTLLDDATWCDAICNSTYFESVLNAKVPTMTSDTTPSGTCGSTPACNVSYPAFQAFDNNDGTEASLQSANTTALVYYAFTSAVEIKKFKYYVTIGGNPQTTISIKYSDDGSNWTTVDKSFPYTVGDTSEYVIDVVSGKHTYWGLERVTDVAKGSVAKTIQFYGRKDI